jgi:16S rRNA processing protein RimM
MITTQTETPQRPTPKPSPFQPPEWVAIATAQGGHGVKGDVKLKTFDVQPDWLDTLKIVHVWPAHPALQAKHPDGIQWHITDARFHVLHRVVVSVTNISNPEEAQLWSGSQLFLPKAQLPTVDETDTFRTVELVGLTAFVEETGEAIGQITGIISTVGTGKAGADYDFLEITYAKSGKTGMIPFIQAFVGDVNLPAKTLQLHGLQSFLEEENTPPPPKPVRLTPYQRRKLKKAAALAAAEADIQPADPLVIEIPEPDDNHNA